jgi:hypothetical protein
MKFKGAGEVVHDKIATKKTVNRMVADRDETY